MNGNIEPLFEQIPEKYFYFMLIAVVLGVGLGMFISTYVPYRVVRLGGTSMSITGQNQSCLAVEHTVKNFTDGSLIVFWSDKSNISIAHRCYELNDKINYICHGDNVNSTWDEINSSKVEGVVVWEKCI